MSIIDAVKDLVAPDPDPVEIPSRVSTRLTRGRSRMMRGFNRRRLCYRFWLGEHYWYLNDKGTLVQQDTTTRMVGGFPAGGKPPHRVRTDQNVIHHLVQEKVSASTQRVPSFQVNPSSVDQKRKEAAELAGKVALYGYDKWRWRRKTQKVVTDALVMGEGFAWPIFDTSIGPFMFDPEQGKPVGAGEIRILTFSRNQVLSEPGIDFDDSPWWAVERALTPDDAMAVDGYLGGRVTADSASGDMPVEPKADTNDLVRVTDYLERPCPNYPKGRWLTMANGRVIAGVADGDDGPSVRPYPLQKADGTVIDEPVIHRLSYTVNPEGDVDLGLVTHLVNPMRTINDCISKMAEWKNRCLNPKILAAENQLISGNDDVPGGVILYRPMGALPPPQWENVPPIPASLFQLKTDTLQTMQLIAGAVSPLSVPPGEQAVESDPDSWQSFIGDLAEFHSRMMRHCLWLVARHYTEEREIGFRGEFGWEPISSFTGADLLSQADVRVLPDSLTKVTKEQVQQELQFLAQAAPGQLTLEQMLSALAEGSTSSLLNAYQYDIARAEDVIQQIKRGPEAFFGQPTRMDPVPITMPDGTTQVQMKPVEGWFPRKVDNAQVQMTVLSKYMKTPDFFNQPQTTQEAFYIYYEQLEQLKAQAIAQVAQAQQQMAESYGMQNAGAPQTPPASPSLPSMQAPPS